MRSEIFTKFSIVIILVTIVKVDCNTQQIYVNKIVLMLRETKEAIEYGKS